jgi:pyruvate dehydrogenase E2 component (dihydrolipoamide acetyltransferase)
VPEDLVEALARQGISPQSYDFAPLSIMRKAIAQRMMESVSTKPHFSLAIKVELDALLAFRAQLNSKSAVNISVNDLMIKASALALKACPEVNVSFTSQGIISHHHADIAFAVTIEGGLITPIIREAETKSLVEIAGETKDLATRARTRRLKPEEYRGGSFSVSNLGMFGISSFDAIINSPQSSILSIGATERSYVFAGESPRAAQILIATLTSDHRVIDGALGAKWLQSFKYFIEQPQLLSADVESVLVI